MSPARQAPVWLRGNDRGPGCLYRERQCGQRYLEVPGEYLPIHRRRTRRRRDRCLKDRGEGEVDGCRLFARHSPVIHGRRPAIGTASTGDLWLENGNGVIMRLVAKAARADVEFGRRRGFP